MFNRVLKDNTKATRPTKYSVQFFGSLEHLTQSNSFRFENFFTFVSGSLQIRKMLGQNYNAQTRFPSNNPFAFNPSRHPMYNPMHFS